MDKIKVISLNNCPFSMAAVNLFNEKNIKIKKKDVTSQEKENFKNNEIDTFPQIYINNSGNDFLLGGFTDIQHINQNVYKIDLDTSIKYLNKKYKKQLTRKTVLRLIQLFNQN